MEVILLQDVENLGDKNDLVTVKPGYARNYLIPQRLAVTANKANKKQYEEWVRQADARQEKLMKELEAVVEKLKNNTVKVGAKAGTSGKIFGSVTSLQLSDAIKKQLNAPIDRKKIELPEDVKMLGEYTATVHLHKDVDVEVKFEVVAE